MEGFCRRSRAINCITMVRSTSSSKLLRTFVLSIAVLVAINLWSSTQLVQQYFPDYETLFQADHSPTAPATKPTNDNIASESAPIVDTYRDNAHVPVSSVPFESTGSNDGSAKSANQPVESPKTNRTNQIQRQRILFHYIFTTSADTVTWRFLKSVEAVFFHHPNAQVIIHSQTIPQNDITFAKFKEAKYDLLVKNYTFEDLLQSSKFVNQTEIETFVNVLSVRRKNKFWYSHETDLIRLLLLEQFGGVYLDTDMHLIKPLDNFTNILGFQGRGNDKVNGAVMKFDQHNRFIQESLEDAISIAAHSYDKRLWEIFGPQLLTRHWNELKNETDIIRAVDMNTFYPYGIYRTKQCFYVPKEESNPIKDNTFAVHLNTGLTKEYNYTVVGSVCDEIFKKNCIFCEFNHTVDRVVDSTVEVPSSSTAS